MDDLIKLVKVYRLTNRLGEKTLLAEQLFARIEPELWHHILNIADLRVAEEVLQETLKAIFTSLKNFRGDTTKEFWGWCYSIADNKVKDQIRKQASDRLQPVPSEELWQLIDASSQIDPLSPGDRLDLEYAMKLLSESKPECNDYLLRHYVFGQTYGEVAQEYGLNYDAARMKVNRCLEEVRLLVA